ncbi:potassium transporter Kef [Agreia sp. PsM10]|uniref:potassium transporter Kef n=1 Tax=Agreia sp. PsM10 TaxID=3030533 RepID=UPI00263AACA3|nr:potassium transporter Kef [Agreia sp. PsM10]MDN4639356.1 potassium transporter Kef [Agreia sp. PsM10]
MIRRPGQAVDDGLQPQTTVVPAVPGFDVDQSIRNVESWGGDSTLYTHFLSLALAADDAAASTDGPLPHTVLTLAALSAWRSGTLDLRQDALARLGEALGSGSVPRQALASAVGLQPSELDDFASAQAESPFGWPARGDGDVVIARVGGFRGLGGAWTAPPLTGEHGDREGRFVITLTDGERWQLDADIFGTSLSRLPSDSAPATAADPVGRPAASGAWPTRLAVFDTSYLAWLLLEKAR